MGMPPHMPTTPSAPLSRTQRLPVTACVAAADALKSCAIAMESAGTQSAMYIELHDAVHAIMRSTTLIDHTQGQRR